LASYRVSFRRNALLNASGDEPILPWQARGMRALATSTLGSLGNAHVIELPLPEPGPGEIRVRVHASAINPADPKTMQGKTSLLHAKGFPLVMGYDLSGEVDALGEGVTDLRVDQAVFGFHAYSRRTRLGAFATHTVLPAAFVAEKPASVSHETAAAAATVGLTALQGLRDNARFKSGYRVLVTGASGGVGSVVLGVTKALGGQADAITSTENVDFVTGLGAGQVFNRASPESFAAIKGPYDIVYDAAPAFSLRSFRHVLAPGGTYVTTLPKFSFLGDIVASPFIRRRVRMVMVKPRRSDLEQLARFLEQGLAVPIAKTVSLEDAPSALDDYDRHGARGKVVLRIAE
jgi:NADPH:quinone reductase-like Zn-dependent oxidoreductase